MQSPEFGEQRQDKEGRYLENLRVNVTKAAQIAFETDPRRNHPVAPDSLSQTDLSIICFLSSKARIAALCPELIDDGHYGLSDLLDQCFLGVKVVVTPDELESAHALSSDSESLNRLYRAGLIELRRDGASNILAEPSPSLLARLKLSPVPEALTTADLSRSYDFAKTAPPLGTAVPSRPHLAGEGWGSLVVESTILPEVVCARGRSIHANYDPDTRRSFKYSPYEGGIPRVFFGGNVLVGDFNRFLAVTVRTPDGYRTKMFYPDSLFGCKLLSPQVTDGGNTVVCLSTPSFGDSPLGRCVRADFGLAIVDISDSSPKMIQFDFSELRAVLGTEDLQNLSIIGAVNRSGTLNICLAFSTSNQQVGRVYPDEMDMEQNPHMWVRPHVNSSPVSLYQDRAECIARLRVTGGKLQLIDRMTLNQGDTFSGSILDPLGVQPDLFYKSERADFLIWGDSGVIGRQVLNQGLFTVSPSGDRLSLRDPETSAITIFHRVTGGGWQPEGRIEPAQFAKLRAGNFTEKGDFVVQQIPRTTFNSSGLHQSINYLLRLSEHVARRPSAAKVLTTAHATAIRHGYSDITALTAGNRLVITSSKDGISVENSTQDNKTASISIARDTVALPGGSVLDVLDGPITSVSCDNTRLIVADRSSTWRLFSIGLEASGRPSCYFVSKSIVLEDVTGPASAYGGFVDVRGGRGDVKNRPLGGDLLCAALSDDPNVVWVVGGHRNIASLHSADGEVLQATQEPFFSSAHLASPIKGGNMMMLVGRENAEVRACIFQRTTSGPQLRWRGSIPKGVERIVDCPSLDGILYVSRTAVQLAPYPWIEDSLNLHPKMLLDNLPEQSAPVVSSDGSLMAIKATCGFDLGIEERLCIVRLDTVTHEARLAAEFLLPSPPIRWVFETGRNSIWVQTHDGQLLSFNLDELL